MLKAGALAFPWAEGSAERLVPMMGRPLASATARDLAMPWVATMAEVSATTMEIRSVPPWAAALSLAPVWEVGSVETSAPTSVERSVPT